MSLSVFAKDLSSEDLTMDRLRNVWDHFNVTNKSPHIDTFKHILRKQFANIAEKKSIDIDKVVIPGNMVARLYDKYRYKSIEVGIKPVQPHLTPLARKYDKTQDGWKINMQTSIIFRPSKKDGNTWIACNVLVGEKVYPLGTQHISVCITHGWTHIQPREGMSSPFAAPEDI